MGSTARVVDPILNGRPPPSVVRRCQFPVCEREQSWTYFTALYFSYTSLLTIGYGELQPTSNGGKPFFVLWTLLAVPTLTIFIRTWATPSSRPSPT